MSQWTPERRQRQAQLIQQWRPWEQSTGPATVDGRAASSRNAYKGGHRAKLRDLSRLLHECEQSRWDLLM